MEDVFADLTETRNEEYSHLLVCQSEGEILPPLLPAAKRAEIHSHSSQKLGRRKAKITSLPPIRTPNPTQVGVLSAQDGKCVVNELEDTY